MHQPRLDKGFTLGVRESWLLSANKPNSLSSAGVLNSSGTPNHLVRFKNNPTDGQDVMMANGMARSNPPAKGSA
jgi:hypothetical protein